MSAARNAKGPVPIDQALHDVLAKTTNSITPGGPDGETTAASRRADFSGEDGRGLNSRMDAVPEPLRPEHAGQAGSGGHPAQEDRGRSLDPESAEALAAFEARKRQKRAAHGLPEELSPGQYLFFPGQETHFTQDTQDKQDTQDSERLTKTQRTQKETQDSEDKQDTEMGPGGADEGLPVGSGQSSPPIAHRDEKLYPDPALPLPDYIKAALEADDCYLESRQEHGCQEWRRYFHFVRLLKAHYELDDLTTWGAWSAFERAVYQLEDVGQIDLEEIEARFSSLWQIIQYVPHRPLDDAAKLAATNPLPVENGTPKYRAFISMAGWLQWWVGKGPILLPTRAVGRMFKCSPRAVSGFIGQAERDGYLVRIRSYKPSERKANEFKFNTEMFRELDPPKW